MFLPESSAYTALPPGMLGSKGAHGKTRERAHEELKLVVCRPLEVSTWSQDFCEANKLWGPRITSSLGWEGHWWEGEALGAHTGWRKCSELEWQSVLTHV